MADAFWMQLGANPAFALEGAEKKREDAEDGRERAARINAARACEPKRGETRRAAFARYRTNAGDDGKPSAGRRAIRRARRPRSPCGRAGALPRRPRREPYTWRASRRAQDGDGHPPVDILAPRGPLAQLGEHQLDKLGVAGSSPARPIGQKPRSSGFFRS